MDIYSKEFEVIKAARKLEWIPQIGSVALELEFQDRKLEFNVSPLQATVVMYFQDQGLL